jgi:Family of unknown function (DUF5335)
MATRKLDKAQWRTYFDQVSKSLIGKRAEIEVDSLSLGSQIETEWLPFLGIVYDPKDDLIEIALEDVDHMIRHPATVFVDEEQLGLSSLEIVDRDGVRQIVLLRDPLMLPPPAAAVA